jgi:hypothetical protein
MYPSTTTIKKQKEKYFKIPLPQVSRVVKCTQPEGSMALSRAGWEGNG